MAREVASVYFHIGNGGVTFSVTDEGTGPVVHVKASHFGHETAHTQVAVSPDDLFVLGAMFDQAAIHEGYSETYCMAASVEEVKPVSLALELEADGVWERPQRCCAGSKDVCCEEAEEECCEGKAPGTCCGDGNFNKPTSEIDREIISCCKSQFPQDDELSMQQGNIWGSSTGNLDIFYSHQFVQNESFTVSSPLPEQVAFTYNFEHTPYLCGTLTGTVYSNDVAKQTFVASSSGNFTFCDIGSPVSPIAVNGSIVENGFTLTWSEPPGKHEIVYSYEYNINPPKEKKNGCCRAK